MQTSSSSPSEAAASTLVLENILRCLPQAARIGSCSLVSKQFRKAAAAVTQSVSKDLQADPAKHDSLLLWLQQHGKGLSSLQLSSPSTPLTALPCDNLLELELSECRVQLDPPGLPDSITGLSRLSLQSCLIMGDGSLAPLASLTGLQHLDIDIALPAADNVQSLVLADPAQPDPAAAAAAAARLSSGALSQLTQLTHLNVSGYLALRDEFLLNLSTLTTLQQLSLRPCQSLSGHGFPPPQLTASGASLASLQHLLRLTKLNLDLRQMSSRLDSEDLSGLTKLTALQHLRLERAEVEVALLPQCPGLVDLQLVDLTCVHSAAEDMLSYLGSLTQLSRLQLSCVIFDDLHGWQVSQDDEPSAAAASSAYTALAASSSLKHWSFKACAGIFNIFNILNDGDSEDDNNRLPAAAWDQFLGTGLQQPGLEIESLELDQVPFEELSARSLYALHQLKTLQRLALSRCAVDPELLSALTQLTYLKLVSVDVSTDDDAVGYDSEDIDED